MGNCKCRDSSGVAPSRSITILMLGLDNSGKSTLIANLNGESTEGTTPTIGFSSTNLEMNDFQIMLYDLGGGSRLRNIWENYYSESYGSIFVVDASDLSRLAEAKETLTGLIQHQKMRGKPLLIFSNKQDSADATDISEVLDLDGIIGDQRNLSLVVKCIGLKSACGNKADPSIKKGVQWLLKKINQNYDQVQERVNTDVIVQRAVEAKKRRERAERVRKIREEREKQKRLAGLTDEEEEEADGGGDPFKPIQQTALETEARENAAKAKNKKIQERLREMQSEDVPAEENTIHPPNDEKSPSHGIMEVQSLSSLSPSSHNSLTDVTPQSHVSSDSIYPSPILSKAVSLPTHRSINVKEDTEKRKRRRSKKRLMSRVRSNKTAPMNLTDLSDSVSEAPFPLKIPSSANTLLIPQKPSHSHTKIDSDSIRLHSSNHSRPTTATSISSRSTLEGSSALPELPSRMKLILPPLKVTKQPVGLEDRTFQTEEDIEAIPQEELTQLSRPSSTIVEHD